MARSAHLRDSAAATFGIPEGKNSAQAAITVQSSWVALQDGGSPLSGRTRLLIKTRDQPIVITRDSGLAAADGWLLDAGDQVELAGDAVVYGRRDASATGDADVRVWEIAE